MLRRVKVGEGNRMSEEFVLSWKEGRGGNGSDSPDCALFPLEDAFCCRTPKIRRTQFEREDTAIVHQISASMGRERWSLAIVICPCEKRQTMHGRMQFRCALSMWHHGCMSGTDGRRVRKSILMFCAS